MSDNTAANLILKEVGGPEGVTAFARSLADEVTRLDRIEPSLNDGTPGDPRDTTSPSAMAETLQALTLGDALSATSRAQLIAWMLACQTGDTKLRAGLPNDWRVGDKTGFGGHGSSNDIAVIWPAQREPIVLTVYLTQCPASNDEKSAAIAAVARAVAEALPR